ncbi:MAG: ABC transporter permease [Oscillospiraceae bacterium]|jgi:putative ABC transport system permease protein|nr:ABC transporter permease [Oscillospiraceae bacterium]
MSGGRISTLKIAVGNIVHKRFRAVCIVLLIAVSTLLITGGTMLGFGLTGGVKSINARLGADAMVVPRSAGESYEGALLTGSPSTFYLTKGTVERVLQTEGIARSSPQLFISTFDSAHCASLVQIIGFDPKTDFVVTPWLKTASVTEPGYGEIVIGNNVQLVVGNKMTVFLLELEVVGKLDKTGMGFDNSVFVNMDTAKMLLTEYEKFDGATPLPEGATAEDVYSAVLLDVEKGVEISSVQRKINLGFRDDDVSCVASQTILESTAKNLNLVIGVLTVLLAAIWFFAVFVLAIIFTLALNERQREFGILRAIGATRRKLTAIVITEASLLCGAGALAGVGVVCLIVFPYSTLIERTLKTAYLPPQSLVAAAILVLCGVGCAVTGPLASLFSAARIAKNEALANIQEG